ncbi:methyl-accepting chemotaxis protein [Heliobacterium mobile]|nr:methyl-accepting chemotaxis protein [Heliobacterium mobile]
MSQEESKTKSLIESIAVAAPFFGQVMLEDAMIGVVDQEKFLAYIPSKTINLGVKPGTPVPQEDQSMQDALQGRPSSLRIPDEAYGVPFLGKTIPIRDDHGNVLGALGIGYNISTQVSIEGLLQQVKEVTEDLKERSRGIAEAVQQLVTIIAEVRSNAEQANQNSYQTEKVLEFIRKIAKQTNLLGINASIEAARFGADGAGFSIVAKEIQALSKNSNGAADQIGRSLDEISQSIHEIAGFLKELDEKVNGYAGMWEEFDDQLETLMTMDSKAQDLIDSLVHA